MTEPVGSPTNQVAGNANPAAGIHAQAAGNGGLQPGQNPAGNAQPPTHRQALLHQVFQQHQLAPLGVDIRAHYIPGNQTIHSYLSQVTDGLQAPGVTHKQAIEAFYDRLEGVDLSNLEWGDRQHVLEDFGKQVTGLEHLTTKEKNYIFVAAIMRDNEILNDTADFVMSVADRYASDDRMNRIGEMQHAWPTGNDDGTLPAGSNTSERGLTNIAYTAASNMVGGGQTVGEGLARTNELLTQIQANRQNRTNNEYTKEEAAFILRASGMLRDVFKFAKEDTNQFIQSMDGNLKNRIVDADAIKSRDNGYRTGLRSAARDIPELYRLRAPSDTSTLPDHGALTTLYDRLYGDTQHWDYNAGVSATTLNFTNFCLAQLDGQSDNLLDNQDKAIRLMQAHFAYWHYGAPDGLAHSQTESLNVLFQAIPEREAQARVLAPILAPVRNAEDIHAMKNTEYHDDTSYAADSDEFPPLLDFRRV